MSDNHLFAWQFPDPDREKTWINYSFSTERWWGGFARNAAEPEDMFADNAWAIGPFTKYQNNPIFAPDPSGWDCGRYDGGVHNGSIVIKDGAFYYVYRGERRIDMYINDGLIAYSSDLIHWESRDNPHQWPGGEGCFALADHNPGRPDDILLFTGGHHTGHFYAVGEVLLSKSDSEKPLAWLPRPALAAEPRFPYENGRDALPPHNPISSFADCIFFNGLTRYKGKWRVYYGGSEYYTCLATAEAGSRG